MNRILAFFVAFTFIGAAFLAPPSHALRVLCLSADYSNSTSQTEPALIATGLFSSEDIDHYNAQSSTPSLGDLTPYDAVLCWSNYPFSSATGLGDVLKQYVDQGGGVVIATYAYSSGWTIGGGILNAGYSPFLTASTQATSGSLDPSSVTQPSHYFFNDVTLSNVSYWQNSNYCNPALNIGGISMAEDTNGNNLIAVNASGNVAGAVIFMGYLNQSTYTSDTRQLIANMLYYVAEASSWTPTPSPTPTETPTPPPVPSTGTTGGLILLISLSAMLIIRRR